MSEEEIASRARAYLSAIDTPITVRHWRELGPRAIPVLESVLSDPDALPSRRAKAIGALSAIGGPRAKELVLRVARSDTEPRGVRASALRGAARVLPPDELASELRPVMERASEASIRATAAEVLARHGGASSCKAVRAQAGRERGNDRNNFTRALARCGDGGSR
jgi:HEAT repeat protein